MKEQTKFKFEVLLVIPSALLLLAGLLLLVGGQVQPAFSQSGTEPLAPAEESCDPNNPIPGKIARLIGDDEVMLAYRYRDSPYIMRTKVFNQVDGALVTTWNKAFDNATTWPELQTGEWLDAIDADLDGDRKAELAVGLKNASNDIAAFADPFNTSATYTDWYKDGDRTSGGTVRDVSVAAGNLDKSLDGSDEVVLAYADDYADFHVDVLDGDNTGRIGSADNAQMADLWEDHHPGHERGDTWDYSVATGDLNGDGYDNEFVTGFNDSGDDLQVIAMRYYTSTQSIKMIYQYDSHADTVMDDSITPATSKWGSVRPLDLATGDLDGDQMDEIVTAYRNGDANNDGTVTLLYMDVVSETTETTPTQRTLNIGNIISKDIDIASQSYEAATSISIKAADLDGDGYDEVALGINLQWAEYDSMTNSLWRRWQQRVYSFEYYPKDSPDWVKSCSTMLTACFVQKGLWHTGSTTFENDVDERSPQAKISLATGDADQDGMDEIGFAHLNPGDMEVKVRVFNAESGNPTQLAGYGVDPGSNNFYDFELAMGDMDGDSVWGTYANKCDTQREAVVQAVVHAPPFWPPEFAPAGFANDWRTQAKFAWSFSRGGGTEKTTTSFLGGSTKLSVAKESKKAGRSASFTNEWEKSVSASTEVMTSTFFGSGVETVPPVSTAPNSEPEYEAVSFIEQGYFCYYYDTDLSTGLGQIPVCIVRPNLKYLTSDTIAEWYESGPEKYASTWVPLGINLAQGRSASQSSTNNSVTPAGDAFRAVDGNTDGVYADKSTSLTNYDSNAWWQVDTGGIQWIDALQIWDRTDAGSDSRLHNFYVFVSEEPIPASATITELINDPHVHHWPESGPYTQTVGISLTVPLDHYGRTVRIQLDHQDYLNLAEVEIYGIPGTPDQWPSGKPLGTVGTTDPFTITWRDGRKQAIPGKLYLVWPDAVTFKVQSGDLPFHTGTSQDQQSVQESGSSQKNTLGMETKIRKGSMSYEKEHSWGTETSQALITTWGKDLEFEGNITGMPAGYPEVMSYTLKPYIWQQVVKPVQGGSQKFLVLDYWVPDASAIPHSASFEAPAVDRRAALSPSADPPQAPLISSPTHPDGNTWYASGTATFNWSQPPGDPAVVMHYHYVLDGSPDTIPLGFNWELTNTTTYTTLEDGVYWVHVRATSDGENWGNTSHFKFQVDTHAPQISLALNPAWPESTGWYVAPVTVNASADEAVGSGVALNGIEVSADGASWNPYTAPLVFNTDTSGTTVYARATDGLGNVSEPVSKTFKIDQTPPDSHVSDGVGDGTLVAEVRTNAQGNQELVLAGAVADNLSGRSTMVLEQDGTYWDKTAQIGVWHPLPDPSIEVNWYYTSTNDLGAGYHIFTGHAVDTAGNQEEPYEIGKVLWLPTENPDLAGSSLSASQSVARPGDQIVFTLVARNAGIQEAHVALSDVLPEGLTLVAELQPPDVTYDSASRTLTWPSRLVWPGQWYRRSFVARVDLSLGATSLENQATFHAFWPNSDSPELSAEQKQQFLDHEQTVTRTLSVAVRPDLPDGADTILPWGMLSSPTGQMATGPDVPLSIQATDDARWMYLREWTPDPLTGEWIVRQSSGWIDFSPELTWTVSEGQGVKFIGLWLNDPAGNVSTLSEASLTFVNRMDGAQVLADGERVQYLGLLNGDEIVSGALTTVSGDPDVYLWKPRNAFLPDRTSLETVGTGEMEEFGETFAPEPGRYLLEIGAVGESEYELSLTGQTEQQYLQALHPLVKGIPPHPLTVSDPLSAGQTGMAPNPMFLYYLPVINR